MWKKFLSLSRFQQIALSVCLFHMFAVLAMTGHHWATKRLRPPRPIAVRTLASPTRSAVPSKPVTTLPSKATAASAKKTAAAQKPKAKSAAKPSKPQPAAKETRALQEIAEKLESLQPASPPSKRTALSLPKPLNEPLAKRKIETQPDEQSLVDPNYAERLIGELQSALDLPEFGEVKVAITIDRSGKAVACSILDSKSAKNAEFLKKRLPELAYPCFNDFGISDATLEFTITFRNVDAP